MLRILGGQRRLCSGVTRRDVLTAGGLSLLGLTLPDLLRSQEAQAAAGSPNSRSTFGKAKSCILLYLYGSPSQLDMCDMKPEAPVEIRGELKPIRSILPGCDVCEYLPRLAQVLDKVTVVRSMTHEFPTHSISYALTGLPVGTGSFNLNPNDPVHQPFIGSVVDYLFQRTRGKNPDSVPDNIGLPFPLSSQRAEVPIAGFQAAYLGSAYAPTWARFRGRGTQRVLRPAYSNAGMFEGIDPYLGVEPDVLYEIGAVGEQVADITLDRLNRRRSLLDQFNQARRSADAMQRESAMDRHRQRAFSLLASPSVRAALDVRREPRALRESYGMNLFGQSTLMARRLVEAGCRFVSVVWDEYGAINTAWDTHYLQYPRLKNELLPAFDAAFSTLLTDLDGRGLLDETMVLVLSEHGRTPQITNVPGSGREHWSQCYTNLFAGGGFGRGRVIGRTDRMGGSVVDRPMSPKDILATVYHLLGIDHHTLLRDRQGRPLQLVDGKVAFHLLA